LKTRGKTVRAFGAGQQEKCTGNFQWGIEITLGVGKKKRKGRQESLVENVQNKEKKTHKVRKKGKRANSITQRWCFAHIIQGMG